jgi:ribonuclease HII
MSSLKNYHDKSKIEVGIDEVGRGCLFGPVVVASVIWDPTILTDPVCIKDSKKLSKKKRDEAYEYIQKHAIDIQIAMIEPDIIDKENILEATKMGMHQCLDKIQMNFDTILVDGPHFDWYTDKNDTIKHHICVIDGDNHYKSIACASIIAKVTRDKYIEDFVKEHPSLDVYDLIQNKGYGTLKHRNAIKEHGISQWHRKTFGICKQF